MSTTSTAPPRKAGALQGIMLLLPVTLSVMGVIVLAPVLPQLQARFGGQPGGDYLVPMILTLPSLVLVLFSPLAGLLADMFGRRRLLLASMALYAVVGVAPIFLNELVPILISRAGVGLAEAMILTLSTTLIGDFFKGREREKWLAYQTATASLSAVVLLAIGGALGTFGWKGPFAVYLFSLVLLVGLLRFTWEPEPDEAEPLGRRGSWAGFPWARTFGICAVTLFAAVMFYTNQIEQSVALSQRGVVSPAQIGLLTAFPSLAVPLGTLVFRLGARLPIGPLLAIEFGLIGAGFLAMSHAPDYRILTAAVAINMLGCGMILPTLLIWAVRGLRFEIRGRGTGIWQGVFSVGQFLTPIAVTLTAQRTGGLFGAFEAFGAACLVAAVVAIILGWGRSTTLAAPAAGAAASRS